jgi:predicted alpha/beta-fold hydrolase
MPVLNTDEYLPAFLFRNNHINTIFPYFFRKRPALTFQRKQVETPDGDFFDVDWLLQSNNDKLMVLLHGLEGSSHSQYILGTASLFQKSGFNVAAINFRSCSGTLNRGKKLYHSGFTEDLEYFLQYHSQPFSQIFLCGFSLGGSVVMNYLGRKYPSDNVSISAAAGVSVPCDLHSGSIRLRKWYNYIYEQKFLTSLTSKIKSLSEINPEVFDAGQIKKVRSLMDFDDYYTAPIHGFKDGLDYYRTCSCLPVLRHVKVPSLLINAQDDSFLTPEAFPYSIAEENDYLHLDAPRYGGHVGFSQFRAETYWNEMKVLNFFKTHSNH